MYFKDEMHQNRFRLGQDPAGGANSTPMQTYGCNRGDLLLREGGRMRGNGGSKGRRGKGEEERDRKARLEIPILVCF